MRLLRRVYVTGLELKFSTTRYFSVPRVRV
jgi:hypothetical protein